MIYCTGNKNSSRKEGLFQIWKFSVYTFSVHLQTAPNGFGCRYCSPVFFSPILFRILQINGFSKPWIIHQLEKIFFEIIFCIFFLGLYLYQLFLLNIMFLCTFLKISYMYNIFFFIIQACYKLFNLSNFHSFWL